MVTVLNGPTSRVTRLVPLCSVVMQTLFDVHVKNLGLKWRPSLSWVRKFIGNLNNSYTAIRKPNQEVVSEYKKEDATDNLLEKIRWLKRQHNVPPDRVWNIDKTALKMLGSRKRGWSSRGQKSEQIQNDKTVSAPSQFAWSSSLCWQALFSVARQAGASQQWMHILPFT